MKDILVEDIVQVCNGELLYGNIKEVLKAVKRDTREIENGDTYIGFSGEHNDGNLLYEDALKNGANICILEKNNVDKVINVKKLKQKYPDKTVILVENTIKALQDIATYKRNLYDIPVIGVTGSAGKTSTKDIIASVLSKKYNVLKTKGNFNNQIGLPLMIMQLKNEDAMVLEMGMNMPGEISTLSKIAKPTVGVITNVGTAHIGNLGSRENILKAKLEILDGLQDGGILAINNDNDMLHNWQESNSSGKINIKTFGIENKSDIMPYDIILSENGSTYKIDIDGKTYNVNVSVGGNHFVLNSLCAILIGRLFGIKMEDILDGIANFELTKRRMQVEKNSQGITIINDCYNANYDSMKAALEYLGKISATTKIAVLGGMLELGKFSKELHEKVGEEVIKNNIDILITVGELANDIAKEALNEGMDKKNVFTCNSNAEAAELIQKLSKKGDAVLLKASNALNFQEIFNIICN